MSSMEKGKGDNSFACILHHRAGCYGEAVVHLHEFFVSFKDLFKIMYISINCIFAVVHSVSTFYTSIYEYNYYVSVVY